MREMIRKFYTVGIIVVIITASGLFYEYTHFNEILTEETRSHITLSSDYIKNEVNHILMTKGQIISDAADYISMENWNDEQMLLYFKNIMQKYPSFASVYFGTPDNKMINGSGWVMPKGFDLRARPWYTKALKEQDLVFSEAFVNASKDKLIITIAKPVYNKSNVFLGVVSGDVSIKDIISIVQDKKIKNMGYSFLIDGKGNVLAHPNYQYDLNSKFKNISEISETISDILEKEKIGITRITLDGADGFISYQKINNTDWTIGSFIPLQEYMKNELQFTRIFINTLTSSLLVFILLLTMGKKYILTPMLLLDKDVQEIDIESNISYRVLIKDSDPFFALRNSINAVLEKTQQYFLQLQENKEELSASNEELTASNDELTASLEQLAAVEEELRGKYDDLIEKECQLIASENTFRTLFEGSSDAILIMEEGRFTDCNTATVELLGYGSKESIIGKAFWEISPENQPDGRLSQDIGLEYLEIADKKGKLKFEWWHNKIDGSSFPVEVMATSIALNDKKVLHILWRDISERKSLEQKLEHLSYRDQLTNLYNRRFYEIEMERLDVQRNLPLTIVMADLNGLKLINDSFGHATGDELLKKFAEVLRQGCRADDIIARIGGDEFIILLPKTNGIETEKIVKRIKALTKKEKVGSINISVSFGWETKNFVEERVQDIFKKAEDYMYKKKLFEGPSMRGKTIQAIINTLHEKNKREEQHSHRVSQLCKNIGKALGLSEGEIEELKTVGLLHDIGKIAIDENILNKPGKLTEKEWLEIKRHPEVGYRILSTVNDMAEMGEYVLAHHERWDGKGYPKGLNNKEISLQSRIITIADAYDAMTSERSYRSAISKEAAIDELKKNMGHQFDPYITKVFIEKVLLEEV
ncbi:MAG: diguanylate cyclase [Lutispora sp.]|nr:diguanylate cyclase [Lutispora sp.]MDD4835012.1 diguanylate cyclase [Lutispora sp.]